MKEPGVEESAVSIGLETFILTSIFFVSAGTITFTHPLIDPAGKAIPRSDNSIVYSLGGGVDYDFARHFRRLRVDYQFEHWNLGTNLTFTPQALSIGAVYLHYRAQPLASPSHSRKILSQCYARRGEPSLSNAFSNRLASILYRE